jgi:hypothetical protein
MPGEQGAGRQGPAFASSDPRRRKTRRGPLPPKPGPPTPEPVSLTHRNLSTNGELLWPRSRPRPETKPGTTGSPGIRGADRAGLALTALTDRLASSTLPELQTFRRALMRWRNEILAHFGTGLTNGRTEGFNNKAKLVKKRAYGYRSFRNYRLRLLNACA